MGGKGPALGGDYSQGNIDKVAVEALRGPFTNLGKTFWTAMGSAPAGGWPEDAAPAAQAPAQAQAPSGGDVAPQAATFGSTDTAAPAPAQQQGSGQTIQDSGPQQGAGDAMAQAVTAAPAQWQDRLKKAASPEGSMTVNGQV